ncbi:hypothetical protein DFH06DRAFT_87419 [Mycena polygramma]|nr:hypothetical protein DFH06DRAFT_87419 [Mycena polygramma]
MIKGIGQLYAFKNHRDLTYGLRGFSADAALHSDIDSSCLIPNRISTRLVLKIYGSTLNKASSGLQLLRAVRDIVCGHRDVFLENKILHRDISFDNLLLASGVEDGVLIDFDMPKTLAEIMDKAKGDSKTGTRAYQSVKVLHLDPKLGHHDHMDDLESIFYVLVEVCFGHGEDGTIVPKDIGHWFSNIKPGFLACVKSTFLRDPLKMIMTRFPEEQKKILRPLMNQLRLFFGKRLDTISNALQAEDPIPFPPFTADAASEDYAKFIGLIENAIQSLEQLPVIPSLLPTPSPITSVNSKHRHDSEERPTTPRKKHRSIATAGDHFSPEAGNSSAWQAPLAAFPTSPGVPSRYTLPTPSGPTQRSVEHARAPQMVPAPFTGSALFDSDDSVIPDAVPDTSEYPTFICILNSSSAL